MEKESIEKAVKEAREKSKKRNFQQRFDLLFNLKNFDLKDTAQKVEAFVVLPHGPGKKRKICAFVSQELFTEAKNRYDHVILDTDFPALLEKKSGIKRLVREYDWFVAEAKIMSKLASALGRFLGPKGKMPNPKAGSVLKSKLEIEDVYKKFQNLVELKPKNEPVLRCSVGNEAMNDADIAENIASVYNAILPLLPQELQNIKSVVVKLTMGQPAYILGGKNESKK